MIRKRLNPGLCGLTLIILALNGLLCGADLPPPEDITKRSSQQGLEDPGVDGKHADPMFANNFTDSIKGKIITPGKRKFVKLSKENWAKMWEDKSGFSQKIPKAGAKSITLKWTVLKQTTAAKFPMRAAGKLSKGKSDSGSSSSSSGSGKENPVWRLAITTTLKVALRLMNKEGGTYETYGTARYGLPSEYKNVAKVFIFKGTAIDYPIKLLPSDGVKLVKPNQEYTSTTQFQFEVTKVSAKKDDLSIKAVDKNNKVLAELKFTSYLHHKLQTLPCKIQHKDTNAPCAQCKKAGIHLHEFNKPHPNKYKEITKCVHCNNYCTPAVLFSLGHGKSQDDVAATGKKIEEFHERGIWPSNNKYTNKYNLTNLKGNDYYKTILNIYKALKNKKGIICSTGGHSRLGWGCYANDYTGNIREPTYWMSDPAKKVTIENNTHSLINVFMIYQ